MGSTCDVCGREPRDDGDPEIGAGQRLDESARLVLTGECPVCRSDLVVARGPGVVDKVDISCTGCELHVLA